MLSCGLNQRGVPEPGQTHTHTPRRRQVGVCSVFGHLEQPEQKGARGRERREREKSEGERERKEGEKWLSVSSTSTTRFGAIS